MKQGWFNKNYWIFFDKEEILKWTEKYEIEDYLPGYGIYGFRGWDDFIVLDGKGFYTVPTVPLCKKYLERLDLNITIELEYDPRFLTTIKWYMKPLIVGGDPEDESNMEFIEMEKHVEYVKWWNAQLKGKI